MEAKKCSRVCQLADMSVVAFLLLISGVRKSRKMVKYNEHKGLQARLKNEKVRLGQGLHLGYAIEGAIGSYYKIDASYLSPNSKMAERLESATKKFGVPLLISGSLFQHFTRTTRNFCRQVDYVTFPGKKEPTRLYTIDVDTTQIELEEEIPYMTPKEKKVKRVTDRIQRDKLREAAY